MKAKVKSEPFRFKTYNDWRRLEVCGYDIRVDDSGRVEMVIRGTKTRHFEEATKFVSDHHALLDAVHRWNSERRVAIKRWKEKTRSHYYCSDRGVLVVVADGVNVLVGNGYGDGDHRLYVRFDGENADVEPPTFHDCGVTLENVKVTALDYDCKGGVRMFDPIDARFVRFGRDGSGDMLMVIVRA